MLHVNVDLYHTTNRTATTNGPISLAGAASLGKYGYGNGIAVMERTLSLKSLSGHSSLCYKTSLNTDVPFHGFFL